MHEANACTVIAVGKNATVDGATLLAHTDDAGGGSADLRLVRVQAQDHAPGSRRSVYHFNGGYPRIVTAERGVHYEPHMEDVNGTVRAQPFSIPLGSIPQVPHTYAYWDQDYGIMNEVQLSIAESTCGARTAGWPLDMTGIGYNMFGIAELSKVALERCDSARCAIQTMGDLAVEYGFYSEDSGDPASPYYDGTSEALAIADKYGEVWIFHILTGPNNASAVWGAERVKDTDVTVLANGFTIREMDLNNTDYYMASPNVLSFAEEMGWWTPKMGPFDFTFAYGSRTLPNLIKPLYTGRRVWRVFDLLAPSLKLDSRLGIVAEYKTYPWSITPDKLIEPQTIMNILRDYYQGTEYDMTKGLSAGPFGSPVRWGGNANDVGGWERPISMFRTIYSFILQARGHLPNHIGGVMWYGQNTPHHTVYVPFSCMQDNVPESYMKGTESHFELGSAWWAFNLVNNWSLLRFNLIHQDIRVKVEDLQNKSIDLRQKLETKGLEMEESKESQDKYIQYMISESNAFASMVVNEWWTLAWELISKFTDGYETTGEAENQMLQLGYPLWWLQLTTYPEWPGHTFTPSEILKTQLGNSWNRLQEDNNTLKLNTSLNVVNMEAQAQAQAPIQSNNIVTNASLSTMVTLVVGILIGVFIGAGLTFIKLQNMERLPLRNRRTGYTTII